MSETSSRTTAWQTAAEELAALRTLWPKEVPHRPAELAAGAGLAETIQHWARTRPDAVAVSYYGWQATWSDVERRVGALAGWLSHRGVGVGDRVGVYMGNSPQYFESFAAIAWLGAVYVPINPMYKAEELRYQLEDSGAIHLIAATQLQKTVDTVLPELGHEVSVTWTDPAAVFLESGTPEPAPGLPISVPSAETAGDWATVLETSPVPPVPSDPDRLAALNYTGGITGRPKGCEHTLGHMAYTAAASAAGMGKTSTSSTRDVSLGFLPMFWIAGQNLGLLLPLYSGGEVAIMNRWKPRVALRAIHDRGVTRLAAPAEGYDEMLQLLATDEFADVDISSLEQSQALSLSRKLDIDLRERWHAQTGLTLREASYGMTETHTSDTFTLGLQDDNRDLRAEPVYCGYPVPGTNIVVVDEDLNPVPVGQEGEILVNSPSVLTGYWRNPTATADTLIDGWLRTGDTGRFDEVGALTYLARTKEMIKVNGMSAFPSEIEALRRMHPDVDTVAVAPREDQAKGQVPVAFVIPTPGAQPDAEELTAWAKENMAVFKVPEFVFVDQMPMTATGKIRKTELVEQVDQLTRAN